MCGRVIFQFLRIENFFWNDFFCFLERLISRTTLNETRCSSRGSTMIDVTDKRFKNILKYVLWARSLQIFRAGKPSFLQIFSGFFFFQNVIMIFPTSLVTKQIVSRVIRRNGRSAKASMNIFLAIKSRIQIQSRH